MILKKLILLDNSDWENHIPKHLIFDEELQIEDNDGLLVENGEQQELDIDDDEWFPTYIKFDCIDEMMPPWIQHMS